MVRSIVILICCFTCFHTLFAQEKYSISGTISDITNGETLVGATATIKELPNIGTVTNAYGFYSLTIPKGEYNLMISYIGYEAQIFKISLSDDKRMDVKLKPDTKTINEVVVSAKKKNDNITSDKMGVEKISPKEVEAVPVLFGEQDVIKTLTLTPGIKSTSEGSGGMFVRGGNNSQNLILLDEATVYNSNHMMGFFSTFNSDAIKDITLYKGTASAQYGGRLSSVLEVQMNDGNNQDYHIGGGIGLISSKLNLQGPIVKDKGSFLITGRRTYADLFLKLSSDDDINSNKLYFYDLNVKANYKVNDNNRVFLSGYFGRDVMKAQDLFGLDWGNKTGTIRWNHIWSNKLFSNTSLIYSKYDYDVRINVDELDISYLSLIENMEIKHDFQWFVGSNDNLNFGVFGRRNNITPGQLKVYSGAMNTIDIQKRHNFEYGAFVSNEWKPNAKLSITAGLRLNCFDLVGAGDFYSYDNNEVVDTTYYGSGKVVQSYINLEPRLNMAYVLNEQNSVKLSYTRNVQNLHLIQNSSTSTPTDIWIASSKNIKPEMSDQISTGYFRNFNQDKYQLSAELYYKWMYNQLDLKDGANTMANDQVEGELLFGEGRAYGFEFMLKKKAGRFNGWMSYCLSRTEKKIDNVNNNEWYPARQDATHDFSVVGMYKLNDKWNLSATWVYYTGNAITFPSGKYRVNGDVQFYYTERNGYRMPDYHRLDLGATCQLKKTEKFESSLSFSLYNAYGRKNAYSISFEVDPDDETRTIAQKIYLFTFIPSVSYNFKF